MRHTKRLTFTLLIGLLLALTGGAAAQETDTTYVVREGNTLDAIAAFFNVAIDCLAEDNDLTATSEVIPGESLIISAECPPYIAAIDLTTDDALPDGEVNGQGGGAAIVPQVQPLTPGQGGGTGGGTYLVQRGDRLSRIARDYGVSVRCLVFANNIFNPDLIYVGQTLFIPADCTPFDQGGGVISPGPGQPTLPGGQFGNRIILRTQTGFREYLVQPDGSYIVRAGDILDFIALAFDVQTECLAASNGLPDPSRIRPGQRLSINRACPPWDGPPGPVPHFGPAVG